MMLLYPTVASPGVSGVQGHSPGGDLGAKPPEAEKHGINFALRITLVNAYRPFYSSHIITFVIGFSRSSHISDFQSLPYSSPTHTPTYFSMALKRRDAVPVSHTSWSPLNAVASITISLATIIFSHRFCAYRSYSAY